MASNSPKYRDYFITANLDAECYEDVLERVKELNYKLFGAIYHDKDILREALPDGSIKETPKRKHFHCVVELRNPISFNSMQTRFPGAHIETIHYKKSAYQYLVHNSPNSKEKYQYSLDEIISNDLNAVKFAIESETFEIFKENNWLRYMAEGVRTPYQFTKRFGLNAYKQYWKPYSDMLSNLTTDEEMQADLDEVMRQIEDEMPF